jgi:hypothetical protein
MAFLSETKRINLELHLVNSFPFRSEKNKLGTAFLKKESLLNNKNYIDIYFMPKKSKGIGK